MNPCLRLTPQLSWTWRQLFKLKALPSFLGKALFQLYTSYTRELNFIACAAQNFKTRISDVLILKYIYIYIYKTQNREFTTPLKNLSPEETVFCSTPSKINHVVLKYKNTKNSLLQTLLFAYPAAAFPLFLAHRTPGLVPEYTLIPTFRVNPDLCKSIMVIPLTVLGSGVGMWPNLTIKDCEGGIPWWRSG